MNELEEFLRKMREKATGNSEEFFARASQEAHNNDKIFRLELLYDEVTKTVILQGNQVGLEYLIETIRRLAQPDAISGSHVHFDETNLSKNELDLIIQHVKGDDMGSHVKIQ
jgi:hypothetical protein